MMKISKLSIVVYFVVIVAAIRFSIVGIDCWKNYKNQQIVKETIIPEAEKFLREHEFYYRENIQYVRDSVALGNL